MNRLHNKDFSIAFKTGTDANKSKFKKECVQGEIYHATDTGFFYIAEVTAGASDATLSKFGGLPSITNTYAVEFDATNVYMDAGTSSDYSIVGGGTLSYWFNPSFTTSTYTESVGKRSTAGFQITHTLTGGGTSMTIGVINHTFSGGNPVVSISTQNQWYLLTVVFQSSGGATLYLNDGSSGASGTGSTSAKPSYSYTEDATAPLYIARHPTVLTRCFRGLIDEVSIFNSELSASDVETIYNSGTAYDLSSYSPVSWWRMGDNDGGTGTTITNQGSGGNDGTLTNGPTFSTTVP